MIAKTSIAAESSIVVEDDWIFRVIWRRQRVGYAYCSVNGSSLQIQDIQLEKAFRGHGIGNLLMHRIITEAKAAQMKMIWGCVTPDDIKTTQYLLDWYCTFGFEVREPDERCIKPAVKMITRGEMLEDPVTF